MSKNSPNAFEGETFEYYRKREKKINKAKKILEKYDVNVFKEIDWWRTYGEYVSRIHTNIDAEACGYADGDKEYEDNFNQNSNQY